MERRRGERIEIARLRQEALVLEMEEESKRQKRQRAAHRRTKTEELIQALEISEGVIDSIAIGIGNIPAEKNSVVSEGRNSSFISPPPPDVNMTDRRYIDIFINK